MTAAVVRAIVPLGDPSGAGIVPALLQYREAQGSPAFEVMAGTAEASGFPVSASTLARLARGHVVARTGLPKMNTIAAFVYGCGGTTAHVEVFVTAWRIVRLERPFSAEDRYRLRIEL